MQSSESKLKKYASILNDVAPKDHFLAYINNKEANILKKAGGSGIMTEAGIPSFVEYGGRDAFEGAKSTGSVGGDVDRGNRNSNVDPSLQEALRKQSVKQSDPSLGDPDPEVDVATKDRQDTITRYSDNLKANIASNPYSVLTPTATLLGTAIQTARARNMLGLDTDFEDVSNNGNKDINVGGDGELSNQQINELVSYAPFLISQTQAPKSMVNKYFQDLAKQQSDLANWSPGKPPPDGYRVVNMLGDTFLERTSPSIQEMLMLPSPLSTNLQTGYNNAKSTIQSILNVQSVEDQYGFAKQQNLLNLNLTGLI
jgi:hypothetical protein